MTTANCRIVSIINAFMSFDMVTGVKGEAFDAACLGLRDACDGLFGHTGTSAGNFEDIPAQVRGTFFPEPICRVTTSRPGDFQWNPICIPHPLLWTEGLACHGP